MPIALGDPRFVIHIATFDTTTGVDIPWLDSSYVEVFNGELSALANNRLDINLSQTFSYDPAEGHLLLTVREFSLSQGTAFFDVHENTGTTNSRFLAFPYNWNQGLVTGFNDVTASVPEPATWTMMIGGFALAGAAMRRRRTAVSFA